jgi:hypothetical protein
MFDGRNLLDVPAKNAGEYARNLLKILFKQHELQSCLIPSQQAKRYLKSELDHERMKLLNGKRKSSLPSSSECFLLMITEAIRTRYRISKYHYHSFYKERLQSTLAACLYNEGQRKSKKQAIQMENEMITEEPSAVQPNSSTMITFD